jgi:eukaryotic-like serine/threonine-protein kinase
VELQLLVLSGPNKGKVFPLSGAGPFLVGRGNQAHVQLDDPVLSRIHCQILIDEEQVVLFDADSKTGTFANGQPVRECVLAPGDIIQIGETQIRVRRVQSEESAVPEEEPLPVRPPAPRPRAAKKRSRRDRLPRVKVVAPEEPGSLPELSRDQLHTLVGHNVGHFRLQSYLARGQSGVVFRGHDFKYTRPVAVKVLWPEFAGNEAEFWRFIRAMRTMMPLRHPHLVSVYGAGKTGIYCWIAMEFVEGRSLDQLLDREGTPRPLPWQQGLRVATHLCRGLDFAHRYQIIHRNVTPPNILISFKGLNAKLGDVMLAKALEGSLAHQLTGMGEMLGDARYLAPERTTGAPSDVDERSDIYSVGAVAHAMLTGHPPVEGRSLVETLLKVRQEVPASLRKVQPVIPQALDRLVLQALAKDPAERPQTATDMLNALERLALARGIEV